MNKPLKIEKKDDMVEYAYQILKQQILTLKMCPGQMLSDVIISKQLNMSRTPVREALVKLINDGLVTVSNKKMMVSYIDINDIKEIFQARIAIESTCATILVENKASSMLKEQLKTIYKKQKENVNKEFDFEFDYNFHLMIVKGSNNGRLVNFFENLSIQIGRLYWLTMFNDSWKINTLKEHGLILDAILNDDVPAVQIAIKEHLEMTQQNYLRILETTPFINVLSKPSMIQEQ